MAKVHRVHIGADCFKIQACLEFFQCAQKLFVAKAMQTPAGRNALGLNPEVIDLVPS